MKAKCECCGKRYETRDRFCSGNCRVKAFRAAKKKIKKVDIK